ncbi:MAG: hypothetical protein QF510_00335, partial [Rhodospirillales bacterium]|nr:hypothetical protein [Rhodospirillales bacterium]
AARGASSGSTANSAPRARSKALSLARSVPRGGGDAAGSGRRSFAARRRWAADNCNVLTAFISGYLDGLAWTLDPMNRNEGADVLLRNMPNINPKAIDRVMDKLLSPATGLTPDATIDGDGFETVLALRSQYGEREVTDASKYLDLSFYQQALSVRTR